MATVKDTLTRVRDYVAAGHATRSGLAVRAGLTVNALRGLDSAEWNPTAETLGKLEAAISESFVADVPQASVLAGKRLLLIVAGGIAAYKCLELIRRLRERGTTVRCVLTEAGARFVTPLSLAAISGDKVYQDLFSLTDGERDRPHSPGPRRRPGAGGARHRRHPGAHGRRHRRRPGDHGAAGHRPAGDGGAGHESTHVGARRDPVQYRRPRGARCAPRRAGNRRDGRGRCLGRRAHGRARRHPRRRPGILRRRTAAPMGGGPW